MDRAIVRIRGGMAQRRAQEGFEFRGRHLAAAHRKITVLDGAEPRDMAGDRNVPRRIRKNHLGPLVSEKPLVALAHQGIGAKDAMPAEQPEISQLRHWRPGLVERRKIILFVVAGAFEGDVDLAHLKAADAKVDLAADLQNVGELQLQRIKIPARVLAKPVEREPQHPQFGLVEVGNGHGGDLGQAEPLGGNSQSPTGNHAAVRVDDDGKDEAELFDARLQLADLGGWVFARLSAERLQRFNADEIWIEIAGYGKAVPAQHVGQALQSQIVRSTCAALENLHDAIAALETLPVPAIEALRDYVAER